MKKTIFTILIMALFSSGCSLYQIDSKETSDEYYSPKTNVDQVTYIEQLDNSKPYTEIGTVSVTTERRQSMDDVLPKLKQEAGILGADAITDVESSATDTWKAYAPQRILGNAYIRTIYTAKAIVWK